MPLSWNEIKSRAIAFSKEWADEVSEDAEAKSFWDDFFHVFGISRRRVATFEEQVKKIDNKTGFIDLLWKGIILIEHKSRGKNLDRAFQQAKDYFPGLKERELPRYILVSDFECFRLFDLEDDTHHEFKLLDFVNNVHLFGFIAGYQKRTFKEQDPVNIEAAQLMGKLHDKLKTIGYGGHSLELYLVRLLFCLFADDTSIFEKGIFQEYIEQKTNEDGSDLAGHVGQLFQVLNTPENKRFTNLDEALMAFPYVNGKLFEEHLSLAHFDSDMRKILLDSCLLDWGKISPAIFGSLFQSVMDDKARRNLGAHYTSEKNILKLIKPLFLDELWQEFEKIKNDKNKLNKLHEKISKLRFLDPACGCGNFLIIAYRELRLLELEILKLILKGQQVTSINDYFLIDVDQYYGIEFEEFPSQIAPVALWLMDHQMNEQASVYFGEYYRRIPLTKSATIVHGNALRIDWQSLIQPLPWEKHEIRFHYILGNPPFIGKHMQGLEQKQDMDTVFHGVNGLGVLDYVSAWYIKAAQYMQKSNQIEEKDFPKTKTAFVSTNSISQGEQVAILWNELLFKYNVKIHFAHRTFKWTNEAKGNAAVHCVIIGFANFDVNSKYIYEYDNVSGEPHAIRAKNINPYLVDANNLLISSKKKPICPVQEMINGSMPNDDGNLLLTTDEKDQLIQRNPEAIKFIRKFVGAVEYLNSKERWCIWLKDVDPTELRKLPKILERIENVKTFRKNSTRETTRNLANFPTLFGEIRQPNVDYLIAPVVSSESRKYIPIAILSKDIIASNLVNIIPDASPYTFGVMISEMMMTWIRTVAGRLKSDWRFTKDNVYNNFPWPENPTTKQKEIIEKAAQSVLDERLNFKGNSLADLYDPNTMPPALVKSHQALDKAVDLCYRTQPFPNETKRIEFLFELYDKYTSGLFFKVKKRK
jgi:hypothetical protein